MKILDLPFRERPILDLLDLVNVERDEPNHDYAGYGWAHVPCIWLDGLQLDDVLVLALHSADDGEPITNDIDLQFELPGAEPVRVLATLFIEKWIPQLPKAKAIALAMCNPHGAVLTLKAPVPIYYGNGGDVVAWFDEGGADSRIRLASDGTWVRVDP